MATPRRIYRIYHALHANVGELSDFLVAKGEPLPGTVKMLLKGDAAKLLARWGEEMEELCGVLDRSHDDPYTMESTQTFYWASLFSAVRGATWDDLKFDDNRRAAVNCGIASIPELKAAVQRVVAAGPDVVKPEKLFLLWNVADLTYRRITPAEDQFTLEQVLECDLYEMTKREYLKPILAMIAD